MHARRGAPPTPAALGYGPAGARRPPATQTTRGAAPQKGAPSTGIPEIRRGSKVPSGYNQPYLPEA